MTKETAHLLENWREEHNAAYLYDQLVVVEEGLNRRLFENLKLASERQAGIWEDALKRHGVAVPPFRPSGRARLAAMLLRHVHPRHLLPVLAALKVRGLGIYRAGKVIPATEPQGEPVLTATPAEDRRHRATRGGGALRAAVFGVNDGLVSNAGLIVGMTGAGSEPDTILIAGVAGLLAGGFSMAAGEYISVRTQREVYEQQIAIERDEIAEFPEEEIAELTEIYFAKGLPFDQASALARKMIENPEVGLDTLAREELGLDPDSLGSPWAAAGASFASFVAGAAIPLLPNVFGTGAAALWMTIGASLGALFVIGATMSLFTGRRALWSAARMMFIGALAGGATYLIGKTFDVAL